VKQTIVGLIGAIILLAIAFMPSVIAAAEESESIHIGEHLLILLAGVALAFAVQPVIRHYLAGYLHHSGWGTGIAALGLLLLVVVESPAVDALAETAIVLHMVQHLMVLISGGLIGTGLLTLASGSTHTTVPRAR